MTVKSLVLDEAIHSVTMLDDEELARSVFITSRPKGRNWSDLFQGR
jgi:hypothetical protein